MKSVRFWQTQKCSNIDMGSKELSTTLWSFGATQNMRKNDNPSGVCHEPGRVWITTGPHPGQETEFQATYQALANPTSRSAKMCLVRCSLVAGTCWDGGPDRIVGRADSEHWWMSVECGDGIEVPSFGNLVLQVFFWNHWSIAELAKPRFLVFPWTLLGSVPQNWRSALTSPKESKIRAQWFQSKASMISIRFQLFQKQVTTSQESNFHFEQYATGMAFQCGKQCLAKSSNYEKCGPILQWWGHSADLPRSECRTRSRVQKAFVNSNSAPKRRQVRTQTPANPAQMDSHMHIQTSHIHLLPHSQRLTCSFLH
jgi:hypothetical protein